MPIGYSYQTCSFCALSSDDRKSCIRILNEGEAVNVKSAAKELPLARLVAVAKFEQQIVGLGAIKRPRPRYAKHKAQQSGFEFDSRMCELGYVAVDIKHRGKHISHEILERLLSKQEGSLFATTGNARMQTALARAGFTRRGRDWQGDNGALSLWIREMNRRVG